jgi:hypothetical protein
MIVGFGLVGASLRRRARLRPNAHPSGRAPARPHGG